MKGNILDNFLFSCAHHPAHGNDVATGGLAEDDRQRKPTPGRQGVLRSGVIMSSWGKKGRRGLKEIREAAGCCGLSSSIFLYSNILL